MRVNLFRSPLVFALLVAIALVAFYNWRFWSETIEAAQAASVEDFLFLLSLAVILVLGHAGILLLMPDTKSLRIVAAGLFLIAAVAAFFIDSYSAIIDKEMIRNVFETDRQEAEAFLIPSLGVYLFLFGIIPAGIALRLKLEPPPLWRRLAQRLGFYLIGIVICAALMLQFFPYYTSVFSERHMRGYLNPIQPIFGLAGYLRTEFFRVDRTFINDPADHAHALPESVAQKPLLLFLVVGETARAKNFQLGGYPRPTNPELAQLSSLYYFDNVNSCGTSTAVSVPCMFAPRGHAGLNVAEARSHSNLLDALQSAAVNVEWRENNSSSKGVGARVGTINFLGGANAATCAKDGCYDENMIAGLAEQLNDLKQNTVIVFHDMGSHGPAYWRRFPPAFERFRRGCRTNELWKCLRESLINTYDNTILYTDHVLAERIRLLRSLSGAADTLLIYVSDHGESLGEHGLYLHGTPYAFAPEEQTKVPFLIWVSDSYHQRYAIDDKCLKAQLHNPLTHDNLYHTVLGVLGLRNAHYRKELDLVGPCWTVTQGQSARNTPSWRRAVTSEATHLAGCYQNAAKSHKDDSCYGAD